MKAVLITCLFASHFGHAVLASGSARLVAPFFSNYPTLDHCELFFNTGEQLSLKYLFENNLSDKHSRQASVDTVLKPFDGKSTEDLKKEMRSFLKQYPDFHPKKLFHIFLTHSHHYLFLNESTQKQFLVFDVQKPTISDHELLVEKHAHIIIKEFTEGDHISTELGILALPIAA